VRANVRLRENRRRDAGGERSLALGILTPH
jgi:hypothetical protein